jgi:hypothetical protein
MSNTHYLVDYVTEGGTAGTVKRGSLENAKGAAAHFKRQGAAVRIIKVTGHKTEIMEG